MYIPRLNRVEDQNLLFEVIQQFNFGLLISAQNNVPVATHLPFMLNTHEGEHGTLITHLARANDQWKHFEAGNEVLAVFQGQHGYISPSWYEEPLNVPTWNYVVVHAYGVPKIVSDGAQVKQILGDLVNYHESGFESPWQMESLPDDFVEMNMQALVAIEIPITRLEGKFKLSQNRSQRDQKQVMEELSHSHHQGDQDLAEIMQKHLQGG